MTRFPKITTRAMHEVDASGISVGRLASQCARLLVGKHRVAYAPHQDCGDAVLVRNISKARWTGTKLTSKLYHRHSGRPGGLKSTPLGVLWQRDPKRALGLAVLRMLPKTRHRKSMFARLKITSN